MVIYCNLKYSMGFVKVCYEKESKNPTDIRKIVYFVDGGCYASFLFPFIILKENNGFSREDVKRFESWLCKVGNVLNRL